MAKLTISQILGLGRKTSKSSLQPINDFQHLAVNADNDTSNDPQQEQAMTLIESSDEKPTAPKKHSRGHNVAVSEEAKNSPVLAVKLLRETDLSSKKIRTRLSEEPEALSKYTIKYMEENDPTWEFLDDEERVRKAFQVSANKGDINGYMTARHQAVQALKKMEEPMTEDEVKKMIENTRQMMNEINPNTEDNIAARKKADEEFEKSMVEAAAKRQKAYEKSGAIFRG
ncbi:hypothetical protein [Providencia rettgeri]|uniref:hypothetical protein n=1 Tax=Providencia rettgeri TaxID=587 RepID=UPI00069F8382|nr:hypothetical protein [Providencia rettgeri]